MYKTLYRYGFISYALLLALSFFFYKERIIFMDGACQLFYMLAGDGFAIQSNRFGAVVTQVFPVVGSKLGMSLKSILIFYSAGITSYYFLCYVICGSVFKKYEYALIVLLFNILFATETFFWPIPELPQGFAMLLVMLALLETNIQLLLKLLIAASLAITAAFMHPLIIFPGVFLFLYLALLKPTGINKPVHFAMLVLFTASYLSKAYLFTVAYEANVSSGVTSNINATALANYFSLYSVKSFAANCAGKFIWIPVVFIATVIFYFINRRWLLFGLYLLFCIGFFLMVTLSFSSKDVPIFYIENLYAPLSILLAAPLVFELLPQFRNKNIPVAILMILTVSFAYRIYNRHHIYTGRLNWERSFLAKHGHQKLVVDEKQVPMDTLIMSWPTSYEFWLLSTIEQGTTASIAISANIEPLIPPPGKTQSFITEYGGYKYFSLPEKYFIFRDTVSEYCVVK